MEGNYNVTMRTPLGPQKGRIGFREEGGRLNGSLHILGGESPFTGGSVNGNNFEFSGIIKRGNYKFEYTVNGTATGDVLKASAMTKFGVFQISGSPA